MWRQTIYATLRRCAPTTLYRKKKNEKKELLGLVKFGSKEHMEDFRRNGTMYMNTVEYFRMLEGRGHVGDEDEGLQSCYQSDRVNVKIKKPDGESILLTKGNGLAGQILTRNNEVRYSFISKRV